MHPPTRPRAPREKPSRAGPTPRQRRALSKINLMALTPSTEIHARFGITPERINGARGGGHHELSPRFAKIQRFRSHPKTIPLLEHSKLWAYARIAELAPRYQGKEIRETLLREQAQNPRLSGITIPTAVGINQMIRRHGLASAEERMAKRNHDRKRAPNQLTPTERTLLMAEISPFIEGLVARYGENRRPIIEKVIAYEIKHAPNLPADPDVRRATFIRYLQGGKRFIASRIRRETAKQWKKAQAAHPQADEEHSAPPTIRLRTGTRLTTNQRLVFDQLQKGKRIGEIAHTLGVSTKTVQNAIKKIRRLITIE